MKKLIGLSTLALLLLGVSSVRATGQSAEDILAKLIDAQGGREALDKIEDRTYSGTMEMVAMGTSASVNMYQKKPDKMRMEFEMMGMMMTQAYDGQTAWGVNPQTGETMVLPERASQSFKRQAIGSDALLHPDQYGVTYVYEGKQTVRDRECHVLEQSFSDGFKVSLFLDAATFLPVKTQSRDVNQMGAEVDAETYYDEYKKVDGIEVPHRITVFQDGQEAMRIAVVEVDFNSGLEDSLFKMN